MTLERTVTVVFSGVDKVTVHRLIDDGTVYLRAEDLAAWLDHLRQSLGDAHPGLLRGVTPDMLLGHISNLVREFTDPDPNDQPGCD